MEKWGPAKCTGELHTKIMGQVNFCMYDDKRDKTVELGLQHVYCVWWLCTIGVVVMQSREEVLCHFTLTASVAVTELKKSSIP